MTTIHIFNFTQSQNNIAENTIEGFDDLLTANEEDIPSLVNIATAVPTPEPPLIKDILCIVGYTTIGIVGVLVFTSFVCTMFVPLKDKCCHKEELMPLIGTDYVSTEEVI